MSNQYLIKSDKILFQLKKSFESTKSFSTRKESILKIGNKNKTHLDLI